MWKTGFSQNRRSTTGDWKDYFLSECEGRLRHLLFETAPVSLLADIFIHFCQDGYEVKTPADKTKMSQSLPHC